MSHCDDVLATGYVAAFVVLRLSVLSHTCSLFYFCSIFPYFVLISMSSACFLLLLLLLLFVAAILFVCRFLLLTVLSIRCCRSFDRSVRLWDVTTGNLLSTYKTRRDVDNCFIDRRVCYSVLFLVIDLVACLLVCIGLTRHCFLFTAVLFVWLICFHRSVLLPRATKVKSICGTDSSPTRPRNR